ncbi:MAG: sulfite exporter TauE/SafE family protein [Armatimonadetes bacterium]|nr:sulfite exporter TauE/SafE family protein [Armatimonadota bacterium]MDW8121619.1 sulfite exporter TauE/SafE family protein [Armatimonadota bacterium]
MALTVLSFLLLQAGGFFLGLSKTGFGGAAGIITTPLFALAMEPRRAVGMMLPLLLLTDVMALYHYRGRVSFYNVGALLPGMLIGIVLGIPVLNIIPDRLFKQFIGVLALSFGLIQISGWRRQPIVSLRQRPPLWVGIAAGIGAGFASTLAHQGGVLTTMYLLPQNLPNDVFVGTATVIYFAVNSVKLLPYIRLSLIDQETLMIGLITTPGVIVGALTGFLFNKMLTQTQFSQIVLILVFVTGIKLIVSP